MVLWLTLSILVLLVGLAVLFAAEWLGRRVGQPNRPPENDFGPRGRDPFED